MPEIRVDAEALAAGGARQLGAGGELMGVAGELSSAIAGAAAAVGDGGAAGAVADWGGSWSRSLSMLGEATARTGSNLDAASSAYRETDDAQMRTR